ncbi:centrosomal protein of 78 kDa [Oryzias melastigma]|uniref:centrosomal protein of 78 kDa n=1 Tax=Oryzias melastigma TaxID=30732 RepID=UPI000CF7D64A|nr:centrosomal protein of 78 kDa [Oryzias melastigma]
MVQDNAQIRQQGAQDFMLYYDFVCAKQETFPVPAVKGSLDKGMLNFNGDRLKPTDWPPILQAISINNHLDHIAISSTYQANHTSGDTVLKRRQHKSTFKRKIPAIRSKDMTFKLCKALRDCLTVSSNLKTLHLNGLPLRERDLITLTKGLAKSTSLKNLSLANCPISDEGVEVICQSVKYSTTIVTVDFTGCSLTWRGADHIANIIKYQGMQRHSTAWAESLRYRHPQLEGMSGLRRITLNSNTLIGDRGAAALARELAEDLWIKALDLQRCGLSNEGGRHLLEALKTNSFLCVLDIRNNPLVDKPLVKTIIEKVLMNADGQPLEYHWIKPPATESQRVFSQTQPRSVREKTLFKKVTSKAASPGGRGTGESRAGIRNSRSCSVPWRAAARAGRQRGLPPGVTVTDHSFQAAATVKITVESDSEEEDKQEEVVADADQRTSFYFHDRVTERQFESLQMELKEYRLRLAEERRARLKAESRLLEIELESARLRDANRSLTEALTATHPASGPSALSALEDEAVLQSIENSFTKFHAFLDLLKDAGLGQIASMAGIDGSDFQPFERPQLSSTVGPHLEDAAFLSRDVQTNSDAAPLGCNGTSGDAIPSRSPSPVRPSGSTDALLVPFSQAVALTAVGAAEEPHQYLNPDFEPDSVSERSYGSQKSFDSNYFGKTFQTQPNPHERTLKSDKSSSSHGYSPNSSFVLRQASRQSSVSRVGSSESVSDIMSDKSESVRSVGGRNGSKGSVVTGGLSQEIRDYTFPWERKTGV